MKTLRVTYDTTIIKTGKKIIREAHHDIKMQDALADRLLCTGECGIIHMAHLELLLQSVELLQGRKFVGSIKHYELVKEEAANED